MVAEPQAPATTAPALPDVLPVLPLRGGMVVFPLAVVPLVVGQERSIRLVDEAMRHDRMLALVAPLPDAPEQPGPEQVHRIGTAAVIHQLMRASDGTLRLIVQGLERIRLLDFTATEPYLIARIEPAPDRTALSVESEALRRAVLDLFPRLGALADELPDELAGAAEGLADPLQVAYLVASTVPLPAEVRQELLELDPVDAKLRRLVELLQHELAVRE